MDVRINVLWRFNLNYKFDVWEIKTSGCHIGSYYFEYPTLLEVIVDALPFVLFDISVKHLAFLALEIVVEIVDVPLGLTEYNASTLFAG